MYHQKYSKLIGIDLSRQTFAKFDKHLTNLFSISQQIDFVEKLEQDDGATTFFYRWKAAKNYSKLFFRFINCIRIIQIIEHQQILNLLNESNDYKFVTRKWNIVNDQSNTNYDVRNEILYDTEVLKSNLCDYNDAYVLVRGDIAIDYRTWSNTSSI